MSTLAHPIYIPHGHCYLWQPELVGLHILGDGLTALAYYSIPLLLLYFAKARRDVPFKDILVLFSVFILACGTTHVLEIWTLWQPDYWVSGAVKLFTGLISIYTAVNLVWIIPKALALPSPAQLEQANQALTAEIQERKQVEVSLRASETRFRTLLQKLRVGVLVQDRQFNVLTHNPAVLNLLGVQQVTSLQQMITDTAAANPGLVIHEDGTPYRVDQLPAAQVLASQAGVRNVVLGITRLARSPRWLLVDADLQPDDQAQAGQVISTFTDITDRRQQEEERQEYASQLQLALRFESMLKRITDKVRDSLDKAQILQSVVEELAQVLAVIGCVIALDNGEFHHSEPGDRPTILANLDKFSIIQSDFPEVQAQIQQQHLIQACDLTGRISAEPVCFLVHLLVDDHKSMGALWVLHEAETVLSPADVRLIDQVVNQCAIAIRQARLYAMAQSQVQDLERLSQLKDDFLSTVSHELRTPISNISMAIHMLKLTDCNERQAKYVAILDNECHREISLINSLLDLQRLEASAYPLEPRAIDLDTWIPEVVTAFSSRFSDYKQEFQLDCNTAQTILVSDVNSIERIIAELLNNACKYTLSGRMIRMKVLAIAAASSPYDNLPMVRLLIQNQADVPMAELPHLFEKFYRIPKSDPWKRGGTGLGLTLVKHLVEHLHGALTVDSQNGWLTFTIDLPNLEIPEMSSLESAT